MHVSILALGSIDQAVLEDIAARLRRTFPFSIRMGKELQHPEGAYDAQRRQYQAPILLKNMKERKAGKSELILGVTDVDIYAPGLNFVFGVADVTAGVVLISLARLREEFYGHRPDQRLFQERSSKEAIHELGHACGLDHCVDAGCVMYFSNSIKDTDRKGSGFCSRCKDILGL